MSSLRNLFFDKNTENCHSVHDVRFFRIRNDFEKDKLKELLSGNKYINIYDQIYGQLQELIKSKNPKIKFDEASLQEEISKHIGDIPLDEYGVWVYYEWSNRLIHILDEEEFVFIRTSRNCYKITPEEQRKLATKKVGIMGLSVGQSVSVTMAMERGFGEIRLADFDILEITNLNRIRTGLHNLGVSKAVSVAREILEIDPFIKVVVYDEGVHEGNMDDFFLKGGCIDLLIDECDGLDIKILARKKAKELRVPVVMEASDRGMIDIERFDLEPNRELLHGLISHLDVNKVKEAKTNEEKIPYLLPMIGIDTISTRLKASMLEIEQTITTWPQLASAVTLGGGITADVARRIFLNQLTVSGRYYVDMDELISEEQVEQKKNQVIPDTDKNAPDYQSLLSEAIAKLETASSIHLSSEQIEDIVYHACLAPSGGNIQPWKWVYKDGQLALFFTELDNDSLLDFDGNASLIALGAAIENAVLRAQKLGVNVKIDYFPLEKSEELVAVLTFHNDVENNDLEPVDVNGLADAIPLRVTNRNLSKREKIDKELIEKIIAPARSIQGVNIQVIDEDESIDKLKKVVSSVERIRVMNPLGHRDFVNEIRWSPEEVHSRKDGIDLDTIDLTLPERVGLRVAKEKKVIEQVASWKGGKIFERLTDKTIDSASALGFVTLPAYNKMNFVLGGRAVQKIWLNANKLNVAFQPQSPSTFVFARMMRGGEGVFNDQELKELQSLRSDFEKVLGQGDNRAEVFLFRFCLANEPKVKSLRKSLDEVFLKI